MTLLFVLLYAFSLCTSYPLANIILSKTLLPLFTTVIMIIIANSYCKNNNYITLKNINQNRIIQLSIALCLLIISIITTINDKDLCCLFMNIYPIIFMPIALIIVKKMIQAYFFNNSLICIQLLLLSITVINTYINYYYATNDFIESLYFIDYILIVVPLIDVYTWYIMYGTITKRIKFKHPLLTYMIYCALTLLNYKMNPFPISFLIPTATILLPQLTLLIMNHVKQWNEPINEARIIVIIFLMPFNFYFLQLCKSQFLFLEKATIFVFCLLLLTFITYIFIRFIQQPKRNNDYLRAYISINKDALKHNIHQFKQIIPNTTHICAVLKGNAYGHNAPLIAHICQQEGIDMIAVACLKEAIELRQCGIDTQILILGDTHPDNAPLIAKYRLIQTISSYPLCKAYNNSGYQIQCALSINTGMHRLGINHNDFKTLNNIASLPNIIIKHVYSHLSDSEDLTYEATQFTLHQINNFNNCIQYLKCLNKSNFTTSLQASFGTLNYPQCAYDYVRLGITLYGVTPNINQKTRTSIDLKPVLSLHAHIIDIHHIQQNEPIGYGHDCIAEKDSIIATVSIGYVDGLFRNYANTYVYINNQKVPIIGKICMDLCMIDITNIDNVNILDAVEFIGINQDAPTLAQSFNTNSVELLSRLSKRLDVRF